TLMRMTSDSGLGRAVPLHYATALHVEGESEWYASGERWTSVPGTLGLKIPGEVYVERARRGRSRFHVLVLDDALVDGARAALEQPASPPRSGAFDGTSDARVRPLMALHRRFLDAASSDAELQETLSEALAALVTLTGRAPARDAPTGNGRVAVSR